MSPVFGFAPLCFSVLLSVICHRPCLFFFNQRRDEVIVGSKATGPQTECGQVTD